MRPPPSSGDPLVVRVVRAALRVATTGFRARESGALEHAHHAAVWVAVRAGDVERAKAVAIHGARLVPDLDASSARRMLHELARVGTCLSRSLAVAARLPRSEVAFGFDPADAPHFRPHAWVLVDGTPLVPHDARATTLTQLRVRS